MVEIIDIVGAVIIIIGWVATIAAPTVFTGWGILLIGFIIAVFPAVFTDPWWGDDNEPGEHV